MFISEGIARLASQTRDARLGDLASIQKHSRRHRRLRGPIESHSGFWNTGQPFQRACGARRASLTLSVHMSEYKFRESERAAIWETDEKKCFYCGIPVFFRDLQIDHVVPEDIPKSKLTKLHPLLAENFEINSIENWVACHQGCNVRKAVYLFKTKTLLYYLEMAEKRAAKARQIIEDFGNARDNEKLISALKVRIENGYLSRSEVRNAIGFTVQRTQTQIDPWVIAFGANFLDPLPVDAPERDPQLSDWLIRELERDLAASGAIFRIIDDERSGETVSVRCAFWVFDFDRIKESVDFFWDVLSLQKYSELFNAPPDDLLDRAVVTRYHEIVDDDSSPVGISSCPACGSRNLEYSSCDTEQETLYVARCRECGRSQSS